MKVAVFSAKRYDRELLAVANAKAGHELAFFEDLLETSTVALGAGCGAVCVFVNDRVDAPVLAALAEGGTGLVALRCTGFNNVDLKAAAAHGIKVVRVTEYSPYSVAEHAVALILALNRKRSDRNDLCNDDFQHLGVRRGQAAGARGAQEWRHE